MSESLRSNTELGKDRDALIGKPHKLSDERIPEGYSLFRRDVQLLNGNWEPAFYSTRSDLRVDPDAWERVAPSIIEGFAWVLQVIDFQDNETADDDRTQEVGNIMSYAMSQGLTEEQVVQCFRDGFAIAFTTKEMSR